MMMDQSMKVVFTTISRKRPGLRPLLLAGMAFLLMTSPSTAQQPVPGPQPIVLTPDMPAPSGVVLPGISPSLMPPAPAAAVNMGMTTLQARQVDNSRLLAIAEAKGFIRDATILPESLQTLFFTAWQHSLLQEAKIGFNTRLPNPGEVGATDSNGEKRDPGIRELSLGGIAFENASSWTVWLNGVRITPNAIPEQVLDIKVKQAFIDLKWFDGYTNKIYPIRLRPHERFNLDSRIFLPGTGTQ
ncbi:MAG TPA: hypothetical protein VIF12_05715 [Micavibrio sp.]